jgi:hypothetical protein
MDKIQLRQISDPERDQVQRAIIAEVETDPDLFIERHVALENAFKGRYVAARKLSTLTEPPAKRGTATISRFIMRQRHSQQSSYRAY